MPRRVIRISQLASTKDKPGLLPVSPATVWRWCRDQKMPAPFKLGEATTVWDLDQIEQFIAQRAGGQQA
jgi:prophage regulatory protein